jgi:hypothetical protein
MPARFSAPFPADILSHRVERKNIVSCIPRKLEEAQTDQGMAGNKIALNRAVPSQENQMPREQEGVCHVIHSQASASFSRAPMPALRPAERRGREPTGLKVAQLARQLRRWWMQRVERHCLICADVEERCAREAQQNVAYYQRQAALARSAQR